MSAQNGATTLFDYQVVILILAGAGTLQAQGAQLLTTSDALLTDLQAGLDILYLLRSILV